MVKKYIVILREPDGRTINHADEESARHQLTWKNWLEKWGESGNLIGGSSLTLNGRIVKGDGTIVLDELHKIGPEIVGGFLLINAKDINEATEIMKTCPIYDFEGYAEIREFQNRII